MKKIDYFGGCPVCGGSDYFLNVFKNVWCVCVEHKKKWNIGYNIFSSWCDETEEDWDRNKKTLSKYEEVEPLEYVEEKHSISEIQKEGINTLVEELSYEEAVEVIKYMMSIKKGR